MFSILIVLSIAAVLLIVVWQWRSRKKLFVLLDAHDCKLCGESLEESLFDYLGKPSAEELRRLDKFQANYAKYKIRCGNCGGYLICADNGMPMNGYYDNSL